VKPVVAVVVALTLFAGIWLTRPRHTPPTAESMKTATNPPAAAVVEAGKPPTESKFNALLGRWVRPDGGYVLEIRSVDSQGIIEAAYFNPNPIHVEKAAALREDGVTKVYVVLRDINYPGSTYTLAYDPLRDLLQGIYFQAIQQQNFEVAFQRLK
jgi:hypothetical protein